MVCSFSCFCAVKAIFIAKVQASVEMSIAQRMWCTSKFVRPVTFVTAPHKKPEYLGLFGFLAVMTQLSFIFTVD